MLKIASSTEVQLPIYVLERLGDFIKWRFF